MTGDRAREHFVSLARFGRVLATRREAAVVAEYVREHGIKVPIHWDFWGVEVITPPFWGELGALLDYPEGTIANANEDVMVSIDLVEERLRKEDAELQEVYDEIHQMRRERDEAQDDA